MSLSSGDEFQPSVEGEMQVDSLKLLPRWGHGGSVSVEVFSFLNSEEQVVQGKHSKRNRKVPPSRSIPASSPQ